MKTLCKLILGHSFRNVLEGRGNNRSFIRWECRVCKETFEEWW